jgi:hypothetical protein
MPLTNPFATENEMDQMCGGFQLTRVQRLYAFGTLFAVGFILSFISTLLLFGGNLGAFAVLYTLGNILSLISTGFLIGFFKQFQKMFDSTRILASGIFLTSMALTLVSAFVIRVQFLTLIFCLIQYLALIWYILLILGTVFRIFPLPEILSSPPLPNASNKSHHQLTLTCF